MKIGVGKRDVHAHDPSVTQPLPARVALRQCHAEQGFEFLRSLLVVHVVHTDPAKCSCRRDVVFEVVDKYALPRLESQPTGREFEDLRLGFAHADFTGDDNDVEHVLPHVAGVVVAPRIRQ